MLVSRKTRERDKVGALFEMFPRVNSSISTMKTPPPYGKLLATDNQRLYLITVITDILP